MPSNHCLWQPLVLVSKAQEPLAVPLSDLLDCMASFSKTPANPVQFLLFWLFNFAKILAFCATVSFEDICSGAWLLVWFAFLRYLATLMMSFGARLSRWFAVIDLVYDALHSTRILVILDLLDELCEWLFVMVLDIDALILIRYRLVRLQCLLHRPLAQNIDNCFLHLIVLLVRHIACLLLLFEEYLLLWNGMRVAERVGMLQPQTIAVGYMLGVLGSGRLGTFHSGNAFITQATLSLNRLRKELNFLSWEHIAAILLRVNVPLGAHRYGLADSFR